MSTAAARPLRASDYAAYALLRAPLALLELPLFVLLPAFYAERLGLALATVGTVLFAARLIDAFADPAIGALLDRRSRTGASAVHRRWILWALPVLALGYVALFRPPAGLSLSLWLALSSVITYLAYSVVSIAYQAWGAALGQTPAQRVTITASREAAGLLGVLLSASLLMPDKTHWLIALFLGFTVLAAAALLRAPLPINRLTAVAEPVASADQAWLSGWREAFARQPFRWLLAVFLCNGIASAIPATLVLFFVGDVLGAPDQAPLFLVAYFLAAALGMPVWARAAPRLGLRRAWLLGIGLAVIGFIWAFALGRGDTGAFLAICLVTGFALGADLALPPAMLATVLADEPGRQAREGTYFGLWNLATKLNLAAAAGLALPLLSLWGYAPSSNASAGATFALSATYALLPCVLKLAAAVLLASAPLPAGCDTRSATDSPPLRAP